MFVWDIRLDDLSQKVQLFICAADAHLIQPGDSNLPAPCIPITDILNDVQRVLILAWGITNVMRKLLLLLAFFVTLSTVLGQPISFPPRSERELPLISAQDGDPPYTAISEELKVFPGPGSWTSSSRITLSIRLLNESFTPRLEASTIYLDEERLVPYWNPNNRTIWASPDMAREDGTHRVALHLQDSEFRSLVAEWSFFQDTLPPMVDLDRLPDVADERVFPISGAVSDENLWEVKVNGFTASVDETSFSVPIVLWPGNNDIQARATDYASNLGLAEGQITWFPPPVANQSYKPLLHENASFSVHFPTSWEVHRDYELEPAITADLVALGSPGGRQSSIAISSRRAGEAMNANLLLSLMQDTILKLGENLKLEIVSRPRILDLATGTKSAQFSLLQQLPQGSRAFLLVTGYWNNNLSRIWLLIGSIPVETIEESWHAVQTAIETFRVIEPLAPPSLPGEPSNVGIDRAFIVTTGTIVFIVSLFVITLYRRRRAARRPPYG